MKQMSFFAAWTLCCRHPKNLHSLAWFCSSAKERKFGGMAGSLRLRAKFGHFAPPSLSLSPFELLATCPDNPQTQLEKFHFTHLNGQLGP